MSTDRLRDGRRIAQLLASELTSGATPDALAVTEADPEVDPTPDGALAYRVRDVDRDAELAAVFVQPTRARVEFRAAPGDVADAIDEGTSSASLTSSDAAEEEGLRVRPKGATPPQTIVFVEDGAEVKRVLPAFEAALDAT